ncbi:DNA adenine methylase [Burkholderia glumae]|uniref:DNA adenine methylase n=1 Tax=Burkholderia glumae TaxID=337 RepID=UPI001297E95D|nr:DNA adenine methylase [Burkholderia glumae]QGA37973.1 DNA adenine methylase [Burkholderia glumae]
MALPIIAWIGGKRRLAEHLIPRFPRHECYVEVFAGGAALYFMRPPARVEVINDVNGELVNLYRVVKNHLEEFVRQFKWALSSRVVFEWHKTTPPETLTDIQRAARFFYLQQQCFGGRVESQSFGTSTTTPPGLNLLRIEETLSAAHLRLSSTCIEQLDWKKCIDRYDREHSFFYLDPPYFETEGYGVPFPLDEYSAIAERMRALKGRAILSMNDHPEIRRIFDCFHIETVDIEYAVGGGGHEVPRRELIIFSWDVLRDPPGLF